MADTVLSVRIDEELKNRFIELAQESGVNNKDLMQLMLTQFELGQISSGSNQYAQDIDELQRLTKRMADIYINMVERSQLRELEIKNQENHQLHQQKEEIERLSEQLSELEEKEKLIQQLKDQVKGLKQEVTVQKDEQRNLKDLNDLLREKNSQLEKRFVEVEVKLEAADEALNEVAKLKAGSDGKDEEIRRLKMKLEVMMNEQLEQKEKYEVQLIHQKETFDQELELITRKQTLELQELRLSLQADCLKQIEQLKEESEQKLQLVMKEKEVLNQRLNEKITEK